MLIVLSTNRVKANDTLTVAQFAGSTFEIESPQLYYTYYDWMINTNIVTGKKVSLYYSNAGTYFITCNAHDDCQDTENTIVYKIIITDNGSSSQQVISSIVCYPNPVINSGPYLQITSAQDNYLGTVSLSDLNGNVFYSNTITLQLGNNMFDFSNNVIGRTGTIVVTFTSSSFSKSFVVNKN